MNAVDIANLINYAFVLFFGIIAAFYMADLPFEEHRRLYALTLPGFSAVQLVCYLLLGQAVVYKCYPLLIHLPLILLIRFVCHRNTYISIIAVLAAYLFCTPRKWFGTLIASFAGNDPMFSNIGAILITIPLLLLIIRYVAPCITRLQHESKMLLSLFMLLPIIYYILEYSFTVYTDLLYTGGAVVVEFMDSAIVILYFIFSMLSLEFSSQIHKAQQANVLLTAAATQAQKEIAQLSKSEQQAAIYRHDMRHHMNFLQSCIQDNRKETALNYINEIYEDLESRRFTRYSANEPLNLILSSYADKASADNIQTDIRITATDFTRFQIMDLCTLLGNAFENAIHACEQMENPDNAYIKLKIYEKSNRLCINMVNTYSMEPVFENKIPVSHKSNHGIGVISMISIIEKYGGVYGFSVSNGEFRFQVSM